ncbi:MAG TPA: CopG family transcriptional regulator [Ignisphaera sp.]|uniref:CopG family transcriptional regulator n=1 Tax=Ignisphaera aggregans TaxID=334771 RepID=A0A833DUS3_9CREN|nr:CopG family transcriptional regulator [Ignisphaera sp.]HIP57174.1 CopG family transcriptional regulator [Ignisphaera aggregans]
MRTIIIKIDDKVYDELERRARSEGFLTVSDYVRNLILRNLGYISTESHSMVSEHEEVSARKGTAVIEKLVTYIERKIHDKINPFTSKIDEVNRKLAEVIERIELLEDKVKELESKASSCHEVTAPHGEEERERKEKPRRTARDILRDQKVMFESEIVKRIKDRDTFFLKLERSGAKIIEAKDERIAVDPDFWHEFVEKVKALSTNNEDKIKEYLDPIEYKLFNKLRESALIYFDATSRRWNLLVE